MEQADFDREPPFPEDLPVADLEVISLQRLLDTDKQEAHRLLETCKQYGFFYLRLDDSEPGTQLLDIVQQMFQLQTRLFDLPLAEKQPYDIHDQGSFFGYSAPGATVIDRKGTRDRMEVWNLGKDDIMQTGPENPNPPILHDNRPLIQSYVRSCHGVALTILQALERQLGLPTGTMNDLHQLDAQSGDHVRFLKVPPQPDVDRRTALGEHTDFGSITVLCNRLSGLRIVDPSRPTATWDQWPWVRPRAGHAIINLGDALVKFTNGLLRSNVHRVDPPQGEQKNTDRYSLVYFSRPRDDVLLTRLDGGDVIPPFAPGAEVEEPVTSKEWIARRALGKRADRFAGADHWDRMAGTESSSKQHLVAVK